MRHLLEGRRFGFALRPMLANLALGLALALTLIDLMAWFGWGSRDTNGFVVAASWLAAATAMLCLLALATAGAEMADAPEDERGLARLDLLGIAVAAVLYAASALLRSGDLGAAGAAPPAFLLAVAGLIVLVIGAGMASLLYAAREWEEIEEEFHERHRRRRAASR